MKRSKIAKLVGVLACCSGVVMMYGGVFGGGVLMFAGFLLFVFGRAFD
jgi:hypothetical protein